eukprot:TRINITY_DN3017_c4_g1_i1.p1 TRINITY_DN3017_c4_g1~~TRINITY_DN3017_c4_g1_i1.p1  ORF type:complete len:453 (+),score=84.26 TRINITY_DN3017_c4_g1_i1:55-1413(+)
MTEGYLDKWKQPYPRQEHGSINAEVERLREVEQRIQRCQGTVDKLSGRVGDCEHRTDASTKLVQLTQQYSEKSAEESANVLRKQEDLIRKLASEVEDLSIHRSMNITAAPSNSNISQLRQEILDEVKTEIKVAVQQELKHVTSQITKSMMDIHNDMQALRTYISNEIRNVTTYCDTKIDSISSNSNNQQQDRDYEVFQNSVISNVNALQQHCRALDEKVAETKSAFKEMKLDEKLSHFATLKADFAAHVQTQKDTLERQGIRAADTSAAIQQLVEMTETCRATMSTEISSVKDWALRCLQRLRKRTETAVHQSRLLKDDMSALKIAIGQSNAQQERQHHVMSELINHQTGKAAVLGDIIDREIASKRTQTSRLRSSSDEDLFSFEPPKPIKEHAPLNLNADQRTAVLNSKYAAMKNKLECTHKKLSKGYKTDEKRYSKRRQHIASQLNDVAF